MQGVAAGALVFVDGAVADATEVVENLCRIERHGALGLEQPDGVGEIAVL